MSSGLGHAVPLQPFLLFLSFLKAARKGIFWGIMLRRAQPRV
jgi:hypothetical protein